MIPTPKDNYDSQVPNPNDFLAVSQGDFLSNFGQLYNAFVRNHIALDAASSAGNHTNVELVQLPVAPHTNVGEISLYSKNVVDQVSQFFLKFQGGNVQGQEVQMTNYQLYFNQIIQPGQFGLFSMLPGGLIIYFGVVFASGTNPVNTLVLHPYITKNLICINLCLSGTTPGISPWVSIVPEASGIIKKLTLHDALPGFAYFYIAIGNT